MASAPPPAQADFSSDPRMRLNEDTGKWTFIGENDVAYEYDEVTRAWIPAVKIRVERKGRKRENHVSLILV